MAVGLYGDAEGGDHQYEYKNKRHKGERGLLTYMLIEQTTTLSFAANPKLERHFTQPG